MTDYSPCITVEIDAVDLAIRKRFIVVGSVVGAVVGSLSWGQCRGVMSWGLSWGQVSDLNISKYVVGSGVNGANLTRLWDFGERFSPGHSGH